MAGVFERYTEQARRAIFFARAEAQLRNDNFICPRHLLAGLTWDSDTRASRIGAVKAGAVDIHASLRMPHLPTSPVPYDSDAEIPLDDDAKRTLAYTVFEADRDRQFWIDTDHLLRGLLRFSNDATQALYAEGLELQQLRKASAQDRREQPPASAPIWPNIRVFAGRYKYVWIVIIVFLLAALLRWMGPVS